MLCTRDSVTAANGVKEVTMPAGSCRSTEAELKFLMIQDPNSVFIC